ncbi:MAG: hypothetical protein P8J50_13145 [Acidimicrobiales bacterium]|nr:hypothetical protein [Acidimicrobiales bacterium]
MFRRVALISLLTWTLLVWTSRIRNVVADDDLTTGGRTWRIAAAVVFIVLALAVIAVWRRAPGRLTPVLGVLVAWTCAWWLIRGVGIIVDDHTLGFTIVHTILMVVSIGLAMWAWALRDG